MTALSAIYATPQDRLISELVKRATRLPLKDLTFLTETANALYEKRLEAEMREASVAERPDTDPHGA